MVQKKKSRKVKKKKSKSIVYQRKQKQKQKHQKQSQSIVVHIHPKKTKSRPRFRNYSHKKAQEYFSSHYQTMAQSRAGYSLYNSIQVKKVIDALKGIKDKNAELREFYVNKYGAEMAGKVKTESIGTSTDPDVVVSMVGERGQPTQNDRALRAWLSGVPVDDRIDQLERLTKKDLWRRALIMGKMNSRDKPSSKASVVVWREYNATF